MHKQKKSPKKVTESKREKLLRKKGICSSLDAYLTIKGVVICIHRFTPATIFTRLTETD